MLFNTNMIKVIRAQFQFRDKGTQNNTQSNQQKAHMKLKEKQLHSKSASIIKC